MRPSGARTSASSSPSRMWGMTDSIASIIAPELGVEHARVQATIDLLDGGATVPFIARYRKEVTGGMDDGQLRQLEQRLEYMRELAARKETILKSIDEQGKLTDELRQKILDVDTKARLEDLYLPFKKSRRTKAAIAREAGLGELVDKLLAGGSPDLAEGYVQEGFEDAASVMAGARAIVVEDISTNADLVGEIREEYFSRGRAESAVIEGKEEQGQKYRDYFEFNEPFGDLPSHRVLALLRGENEGVLRVNFAPGEDDEFYQGIIADRTGLQAQGDPADKFRAECVRFGWRTKLAVSSAVDVRMRLKEKADEAAVSVFSKNLKDLLLAAPAGHRATLGLDPGYRNGVKCAVVDGTGKVLDTVVVYPHSGQWDKARTILSALVNKHGVELLAVGNGTASRETEKLAKEIAGQAAGTTPQTVVISEAGASVYSASEVAAQEFPDMDVSLRGAVSIARRLQDPLAELVKIDPKSIGVGQYQHDVNQALLAAGLDTVVEDAVNSVGVDVNLASAPLLNRVAGVTPTLAENIVAYRDENGAFKSRKELLKVPRLGPKAFEQAAGFLRINGAADLLDASAVHPEAYPLVRRIVDATGVEVAQLVGNSGVLGKLRAGDFADDTFGIPTVTDVLAELDKPGRDPRPTFKTATLAEGIETIKDLQPGMVLEGTVTNVAAFGAFVDIGVHQDGLVHVSAMSDQFVKDPHDVVSSGEVVKVRVVDVDVPRNRIGLSLRLQDEPNAPKAHGRSKSQKSAGHTRNPRRKSNPRNQVPQGSMAAALKNAGFGNSR